MDEVKIKKMFREIRSGFDLDMSTAEYYALPENREIDDNVEREKKNIKKQKEKAEKYREYIEMINTAELLLINKTNKDDRKD